MSKHNTQFALFITALIATSVIYILDNLVIIQREIIVHPEGSKVLFIALATGFIYLLSQFVRALRLRFLISSARFTTKSAIIVQCGSTAIGNVSFPLVKDLLALFLFNYKNPGELTKMIIAILYIRFFDFLVITPLLFTLVISGSAEKQGVAMTLFMIMLGVFFVLILLPRLCKVVIDYLIRFSHTNRALMVIKTLSHLKHNYSSMHLNSFDKAFMVFLLTLFAWSLELAGIYFFTTMSYGWTILESYFALLNNVMSNIPFVPKEAYDDRIYLYPYLALIIFALIFILKTQAKGHNDK